MCLPQLQAAKTHARWHALRCNVLPEPKCPACAVDLLLAGSGRYAAAAVQHALDYGLCAMLVRSLDLSSCCLRDRHVGRLCAAVRHCSMLERLSLAFNGLEWPGVKDISVSLLPYVPALTDLDLSHNGCGGWTHESCAARRSCQHLSLDHNDGPASSAGDLLMRDWRHADILTRSPPRGKRRDGAGVRGEGPCTVSGGGPAALDSATDSGMEPALQVDSSDERMPLVDSEHRQRGIEYQGILHLSRALIGGYAAAQASAESAAHASTEGGVSLGGGASVESVESAMLEGVRTEPPKYL